MTDCRLTAGRDQTNLWEHSYRPRDIVHRYVGGCPDSPSTGCSPPHRVTGRTDVFAAG